MDAVSEVLAARADQSDRLSSMVGASLAAHLAVIVVIVLAPAAWLGSREKPEQAAMVISLGGPVGPRDGGMTPMGGRPIQALAEAKKAIEPVRAPAARAPEMIEPVKKAPKKAEAKVPDAKTPSSRTPIKGEEIRKGSAASAAPSTRGQGFGLSSGGGGTGSYLDTADFCCPEYIALMLEQIRSNWDSRQQALGTALVKYTVQRDGTISGVTLERSSGYQTLDFLATRALLVTRRLPALPQGFTEPSLTVHLTFEYTR
jgi:TonB family protein